MADKGVDKGFDKAVDKGFDKAVDAPPAPEAEIQALGGTAIKPEGWDRTGWEAFKYTLYNPSTGEVLTRTPLSWLKITVFYCIYYSFLAGFWIACLNIFFATLPYTEQGPRWQLDQALIGVNPGVGLRPRNNDKDIDSQMFVLKFNDTNIFPSEREGEGKLNADYATRMEKFLEVYDNKDMNRNAKNETMYNTFDPLAQLGICGKFPYGYVSTTKQPGVKPCIFVKLNTIWGWEPEAIDPTDPIVPESLRKHIEGPQGSALVTENNVWIDCEGRYPADKEALRDNGIEYFPKSRNLGNDYFPYLGKTKDENGTVVLGYHAPLVAIKINPKVFGQLIHIECRAYYDGVRHVTKTKEGLVQFEVQIKKD